MNLAANSGDTVTSVRLHKIRDEIKFSKNSHVLNFIKYSWNFYLHDLLAHLVGGKWVNTLRPTRNRRHFADAIFNGIFLNENVWIPIKFLLKFVPKGPIHNIPALVQIMAWRRPQATSLYLNQWWLVYWRIYICVTRPQWVNPVCAESWIFWKDKVNTTLGARSSAVMVLTMQDKGVLVFQEEGFQLPVISHCWKLIENAEFLCFIK